MSFQELQAICVSLYSVNDGEKDLGLKENSTFAVGKQRQQLILTIHWSRTTFRLSWLLAWPRRTGGDGGWPLQPS
ncbi:unnamed protein product [Pleuronectes platessa]|uniref:Uncharacterized protein n=1 Tax=Pleuronectes platessa TaxID=8262 RepID=A0A9N7UK47_PLEPL|nr:unnamed protein product [Pleuronectes platessa]